MRLWLRTVVAVALVAAIVLTLFLLADRYSGEPRGAGSPPASPLRPGPEQAPAATKEFAWDPDRQTAAFRGASPARCTPDFWRWRVEHAKHVCRLLRVGMTREEVETMLGAPDPGDGETAGLISYVVGYDACLFLRFEGTKLRSWEAVGFELGTLLPDDLAATEADNPIFASLACDFVAAYGKDEVARWMESPACVLTVPQRNALRGAVRSEK